MMPDTQDPGHDPETGEVIEGEGAVSLPPHQAQRPPTLDNFSRLIQALEDGDLNAQLSGDLKDLGQTMVRLAANYGGKQKGKMTLTLEFALEGGTFEIKPKVKVERPMPPRARTHFWATADGGLSQTNPKQTDMFRGQPPRAV